MLIHKDFFLILMKLFLQNKLFFSKLYYIMGKIYNIVLNSAVGTLGTDIRTVSFLFDWQQLPEGRYKVKFTFQSSIFTSTNTTVCMVLTDLCQTNVKFAFPLDYKATQTNSNSFLGFLKFSGTGASSFLFAEDNVNTDLYLDSRPSNNTFTVFLVSNNSSKTAYLSTTLPATYTLVLSFELLD